MRGADTPDAQAPPRVTVVVPTRQRPELLRRAIRSFFAQDCDNITEIVVVFDQSPVEDLSDLESERPRHKRVTTVENTRTPGLAGARNTGILAAGTDLIAFCDDDDEWVPTKLRQQLEVWSGEPAAVAVGTGMTLQTAETARVRSAPARVTFEDFLASREFSIPSSGLLLRRSDLLGPVGLVDEDLPASYGEDWDLLLRLTRRGDLVNVVDPVVIVHWNRPSFYADKWRGIADGLSYLLTKYPEFSKSRTGTSRMASQIAFAKAALGERRDALRWVSRALRRDPRQVRAWATVPVALGLVRPGSLVALANRRGRGL